MANLIAPPVATDFGCYAGENDGLVGESHTHPEVELILPRDGAAEYVVGGRLHHIDPGRLAVYWGALPHGTVSRARGSTQWVTVPLTWLLRARLGESFVARLLAGNVFAGTEPHDDFTVGRWVDEIRNGGDEGRRIALLEIEARLRRIARTSGSPESAPSEGRGALRAARVVRLVSERFTEPLTVAAVAGEVGLHPQSLLRLMKRTCGIGLWEFILQLRIAEAQRLLLTTDLRVTEIAYACGFASPGRFYEAFRRICATTPRAYRARYASL